MDTPQWLVSYSPSPPNRYIRLVFNCSHENHFLKVKCATMITVTNLTLEYDRKRLESHFLNPLHNHVVISFFHAHAGGQNRQERTDWPSPGCHAGTFTPGGSPHGSGCRVGGQGQGGLWSLFIYVKIITFWWFVSWQSLKKSLTHQFIMIFFVLNSSSLSLRMASRPSTTAPGRATWRWSNCWWRRERRRRTSQPKGRRPSCWRCRANTSTSTTTSSTRNTTRTNSSKTKRRVATTLRISISSSFLPFLPRCMHDI